jgi:hypothetical protein
MPPNRDAAGGPVVHELDLKKLFRRKTRGFIQEAIRESPAAAKRERHFRLMRTTLMCLSVLLAAAAGVTVIPAGIAAWVTAALAFAGAAVTGFTTAFAPSKRAEYAARERVQWDDLANDSEIFLVKLDDLRDDDAEKAYIKLRSRRDDLTRCLEELALSEPTK